MIVPEMQGHGRTADVDRPITYEQMADDTAALVAPPRHRAGRRRRLQHGRRHRPTARDPASGAGAAARRRLRELPLRRHAGRGAGDVPVDHAELFAGSPIETEYQRLAPNPDDFPKLVEKLKTLDTTDFAWPEEDIRGIAAPTLIVLGDSDGIRLEHAVEMFKLRGGGVMGDLSGMPQSQLAVLPGTSHFVPPGSGVLDRADWLLAMIPPFLDPPPSG